MAPLHSFLAATLLTVGVASVGHAQEGERASTITSGDLARSCAPGADPADLRFCDGFISGAGQFYEAVLGPKWIRPIACPEHLVSRQEMADVFLAWTRDHGDLMQEKAVEGLMRAAVAKWPCPR
jgi:hypothetical protein